MPLHGLLLVNKPTGLTSHDVVAKVRKVIGMREVGHSGTLDPFASGLMVLLLGEATKISDFVLNGDKAYRVRVRFGVRTDSLDITGQVLSQRSVSLDPSVVMSAAFSLQGEFVWPVPLFSAKKVEGKKLYEFAHNEQIPGEIPQKKMRFWDVQVLSTSADSVEVHLECSKGSYVRTWSSVLGERLDVGGVVEELERTASKPYFLKSALSLSEIVDNSQLIESPAFIPLAEALPSWRAVTIRGKDERLIHNGQISYDLERRLIVEQKLATQSQQVVGIKVLSAETGQILAILEATPNSRVKIRRVFKRT